MIPFGTPATSPRLLPRPIDEPTVVSSRASYDLTAVPVFDVVPLLAPWSPAGTPQGLGPRIEIDASSLRPEFYVVSESFWTKATQLHEEALEHDVYVALSSKRRYVIELEIGSVRRAEPNVVDPD